jgi:hypothetical protein
VLIGHNGGHHLPNALPAGNFPSGEVCAPDGIGAYTRQFFKTVFAGGNPRAVLGLSRAYNLSAVDGSLMGAATRCFSVDRLDDTVPVPIPPLELIVTPTGLGVPIQLEIGQGPIQIAGVPRLSGNLVAAVLEARVFFGLAVGTTAADALVVQDNVMPLRSMLPAVLAPFSIELPGVAIDIPAGKKLYLTVSPLSDMFAGFQSRVPGVIAITDAVVDLPVVP